MTAPRLPFFVYGTLRPGEANHDLFLRGHTLSELPARLPDAMLYAGPGYPYAVEQPGSAVHGDLVTALPDTYTDLLAALDRLEEYTPGDPRNLYERVERKVTLLPDGPRVPAWVYLAAPTLTTHLRTHGTPIPSGNWRSRDPM
ncbi:gamma-glutamylcyclotransferase family protein [Streptomyces sp. YU58]|uniref:gamma-glutamylcyclotransferase family protein n=1 Tax=Streptomyces sp. SX92 TaxID=3158972 RepID=UPI0027BB0878|nr:gamma-glutamylcyclotransferase family protein [Streptomyces coralus]WLW55160.1 gamma-glutamylcyclotransferase family protein [Streptomyces coralus]